MTDKNKKSLHVKTGDRVMVIAGKDKGKSGNVKKAYPSEEVKLAAVKQNWRAIKYIKNPSEEVQLAAVKENREAIKYIENPSEEVQLTAVKQNWWAIKFIENPSEEVIKYVKSQLN